MKEKLFLPPNFKGDLWFYNQERFLDHAYQSFMHRHDELELNLVLRGRGVYVLNRRKIEMLPNTLLWLFPEQEHLLLEKSLDFEMWILVIKQGYLEQICTDESSRTLLECSPEGHFCRSLAAAPFQKLSTLCKEGVGMKADPQSLALFNISLGYILLAAWAAYQSAHSAVSEKHIHPAVDQVARQVMDGKGADDLTVLAQAVHLSPSQLSRVFKKQMGVSLTAFRNRCRVEHFIDLYGDGQSRTMLDDALDAGFGSYAQFYRVFKEIMGGTPAEYRRESREKATGQ
jgi:AraC-like DNA-binding protein